MENQYRTVYVGGMAEIVEKKSRFIAEIFPVFSEEEVLQTLEKTRKQYWDARHHCWAYVLGGQPEVTRCSDDGEPSQTAGKPILDVIMGQELRNVLVIVTRYFGGTLLGTGGLVRAYSKAAQEGLAHSKIITKIFGFKLKINIDYAGLGKIQYILGQRGLHLLDTIYTDMVELIALVPMEEKTRIEAELLEGTNGQAVFEEGETCWFAWMDGEIIIDG
ncbi:MAG: YigZ family protein [Hespellia sp.]|jgi:uncharacterized YigZ family protein|nr:YigZ family protein [Hespellia sp.]